MDQHSDRRAAEPDARADDLESAVARVAIVPAYNEARTIGSTVLGTTPHVDETIVVDDGSSDATAEIAERAGATVRRHDRNRGKGRALKTGIEVGLERANVLVFLDGDGQHDPSLVPRLVGPIERDEADFVIGARTLPGDGTPAIYRHLGRNVLDLLTNLVTDTTISDTQSGFRAIDSSLLADIDVEEHGMGVESAMLVRADGADARIVEVAVPDHYPSMASPSRNPLTHSTTVIRSVLRLLRDSRF